MSEAATASPLKECAAREIIRGQQSTEVRITGTLNQVLREIEVQFYEYPPQGYSTMLLGMVYRDGDRYEARMKRANSCE